MLFLSFGVLSLASSVAAFKAGGGSLRARHAAMREDHFCGDEMLSSFSSVDTYKGADFLNDSLWTFFSSPDPTGGQVNYLSRPDAVQKGLAYVQQDGKAVLRVDSWTDLPLGAPRNSVRISSTKRLSHGLIIADFDSMPFGCAVWPSLWTIGEGTWPNSGEIDIVEGVNKKSNNQYTFHTGANQECNIPKQPPTVDGHPAFTATVMNTNCSSSKSSDTGGAFLDTSDTSFGQGFQSAGGGVFALLWDGNGIKIWRFNRQSIPGDVSAGDPNPDSWPSPNAFLSTDNCNVDSFFSPQMVVLDITLCGGWASSDYPNSGCPGTCSQQVTTGKNFANAQWIINHISMYSN